MSANDANQSDKSTWIPLGIEHSMFSNSGKLSLNLPNSMLAAARSLGLDHATLLRKMRLHDITFNGKSVIR